MSDKAKSRWLKALALTIDVSAPLIATLTQFPIWVKTSAEATVSGVFMLLAFLSCIPFLKHIKRFLQSPSIPIVWLIIFIMLTMLNNIIDQMIVVTFVGMISNAIGMCIYKLGDRIGKRGKEDS